MLSAEQLLQEIQSETLQQLLLSLREDSQPPLKTGIPNLDSYLSRLKFGDAIHIQGASGSGKTHLLYFLLATCALPRDRLEGWNSVAYVFDMDGTFSVCRLHQILVERLRKSLPSGSMGQMADRCLKNIHVFRPASTEQLAVTLAHLPRYHSKHFPESNMGMVAIHSVDSLYWLDRFKAEQLRNSSSSSSKLLVYQNVEAKLAFLRHSYGAIAVLSHWGLPQNNSWIAPPTSDNPQVPPSVEHTIVQPFDMQVIPLHLLCITQTCQIDLSNDFRPGGEVGSRRLDARVQLVGKDTGSTFSFEVNEHGLHLK